MHWSACSPPGEALCSFFQTGRYGAGAKPEALALQEQRCRSKLEPIVIGSRQPPLDPIVLVFARTELSGNGDGTAADSRPFPKKRTQAMIGLGSPLPSLTP